jgi:hypothetical protein
MAPNNDRSNASKDGGRATAGRRSSRGVSGDRAAAAAKRRLDREKRRGRVTQDSPRATQAAFAGVPSFRNVAALTQATRATTLAAFRQLFEGGVRQTRPAAAVAIAAGLGAAAVAAREAMGGSAAHGNAISGDVAIHLFKRIELLTIRLEVRQAPNGRTQGSRSLLPTRGVHLNGGKEH